MLTFILVLVLFFIILGVFVFFVIKFLVIIALAAIALVYGISYIAALSILGEQNTGWAILTSVVGGTLIATVLAKLLEPSNDMTNLPSETNVQPYSAANSSNWFASKSKPFKSVNLYFSTPDIRTKEHLTHKSATSSRNERREENLRIQSEIKRIKAEQILNLEKVARKAKRNERK